METKDLNIQCVRLHKLDGSGSIKAFADISIMDVLVIKALRVVEGREGLFVSIPIEAGKDGKWYNTIIPLTRAVKDEIEKVVMDQYENGV